MQKLILFSITFLIILSGCNSAKDSKNQPAPVVPEKQSIFPVTSFLKGQLIEIDTMPVTPLKIVTANGKRDSVWLKREDIRSYAAPFLEPEIDSLKMTPYFSEKSFLDQTINAFTFSYDPKVKLPDSLSLKHWDVYINPQTNSVSRIYMVKEKNENSITYTSQLTWTVNKWCSIRSITQESGKEPQIKEEKIIWDFD